MLGALNGGAKVLMSGLDYERAVLAAGPIGIMQAVMDNVVPYIHDRKQFGQSIGEFQLIQGKVADMYTVLQAARAFCYTVGKNLDLLGAEHVRQVRKDCASVILWCAEKATWMAGEGIQVFGGNGYINDYPLGRLWRDAKLYEIGAGTIGDPAHADRPGVVCGDDVTTCRHPCPRCAASAALLRELAPRPMPSILRRHADDEAVWRNLFDGFPRPYTLSAHAQAWCAGGARRHCGMVWAHRGRRRRGDRLHRPAARAGLAALQCRGRLLARTQATGGRGIASEALGLLTQWAWPTLPELTPAVRADLREQPGHRRRVAEHCRLRAGGAHAARARSRPAA